VVLEKDGKSVGPIMSKTRKHCMESRAKKHCKHNKQRKTNWTGHMFRRNCLLKHFIAGKAEGMGIRGKRLKQLLNKLKERRIYWKWKEKH